MRGKLVDVPYIGTAADRGYLCLTAEGRGYSTWHVASGIWVRGDLPNNTLLVPTSAAAIWADRDAAATFSPFDIPNLPPGPPAGTCRSLTDSDQT